MRLQNGMSKSFSGGKSFRSNPVDQKRNDEIFGVFQNLEMSLKIYFSKKKKKNLR